MQFSIILENGLQLLSEYSFNTSYSYYRLPVSYLSPSNSINWSSYILFMDLISYFKSICRSIFASISSKLSSSWSQRASILFFMRDMKDTSNCFCNLKSEFLANKGLYALRTSSIVYNGCEKSSVYSISNSIG